MFRELLKIISKKQIKEKNFSRIIFSINFFNNWDFSIFDFNSADFRFANFNSVDFRSANFRSADFRSADFRSADFSFANFSSADFSFADFSSDDFSFADFRSADFRSADFRSADFSSANFSSADFRSADFRSADLNINIDENTFGLTINCPKEGAFIGYKKAKNGVIVKLLIMEDSKRSSATTYKCRASKVMTLEIDGGLQQEIQTAHSNSDLLYRVGKVIEISDFDENRWNECSTGIHFFMSREMAKNYN